MKQNSKFDKKKNAKFGNKIQIHDIDSVIKYFGYKILRSVIILE